MISINDLNKMGEGHYRDDKCTQPCTITTLVNGYRDLHTRYHRMRRAVRDLNNLCKGRRDRDTKIGYGRLLEICSELTWKIGELVGETKTFTWYRFETREEFLEYSAWRKERAKVKKEV